MISNKVTITIENGSAIYGFFEHNRYLSNYHICTNDVEFEGVLYPSSENAYQAAKTEDLELRKQFLNISPKESKQLGSKIEIRKDWDNIKMSVMYDILLSKFTRNTSIKLSLLNTKNKYLEETNWWGDVFWGVCENKGRNELGHLLMLVRSKLNTGK